MHLLATSRVRKVVIIAAMAPPPDALALRLAAAWARAALTLCGCAPAEPAAHTVRVRPKPHIRLYTSNTALVQRQIEVCSARVRAQISSPSEPLFFPRAQFRRARTASRASRERIDRLRISAIPEEHEDRAKWIGIAAVLLLQTYVRATRAASTACERPPAFLRADWEPPGPKEEEERVRNLQRRFPQLSRNAIVESLGEFRGHAGYAAVALARHHGDGCAGCDCLR